MAFVPIDGDDQLCCGRIRAYKEWPWEEDGQKQYEGLLRKVSDTRERGREGRGGTRGWGWVGGWVGPLSKGEVGFGRFNVLTLLLVIYHLFFFLEGGLSIFKWGVPR